MIRAVRPLLAVFATLALILPAAAAAPASAGAPEVAIWHGYSGSGTGEAAALAQVLANVQARYPGITITAEDHGPNVVFDYFDQASGGNPDLLVYPNDYLYFEWLYAPMTDVTATVRARPTTRGDAVRGSTVDGHIVQIPESLKAVALYYDKHAMPQPPVTTGQLMAALRNGRRLGIAGSEYGLAYYAYGLYGAFGGQVIDGAGRCIADRTPGVANAMAWLRDAVAAGLTVYPDSQTAVDAMANHQLDGFFDGNWEFGTLVDAVGSRLGVVPGPKGPGGPFRALVGVDGYVVNSASPDGAAALTVAKAMTDRAAQKTFMQVAGHVPADASVGITDPRVQAFGVAIRQGFERPTTGEFYSYFNWFPQAFVDVLHGADPTQTVSDACAGMNADNGF
jgi:maltose-binding protein MalE